MPVFVCPQNAGASALDNVVSTFAAGAAVTVAASPIPASARGYTIYNDTAAAIEFTISGASGGTHVYPPRASHSIDLPEGIPSFTGDWSVATVAGNAGAPQSPGVPPSVYLDWHIWTP